MLATTTSTMPYMTLGNMLFQTFSIFTGSITTIHTSSQYQTTCQNHPMICISILDFKRK
ncbi:Uncharacterised protein [Legionella londiniensis]|uniref:Uncharacterized protein n=1 Tax=Legionella londiniensis TaxID=45068 RepID=A0A0W0VNA5_9GAMM|nr:hypothetical protein Llon_1323 [Legionella londiniensis]STX93250.1 Uncharacterised protein [Legionella londiniensis]